MTGPLHDPGVLQVALAASLILINGAVSMLLQLRLGRRLLLAAIRTVVQLTLVGMVLRYVFAGSGMLQVAGLGVFMTLVAGVAAVRRVEFRYRGIFADGILTMLASSWLVAAWALSVVIPPSDWTGQPARYLIPLLGMLLGNTLNGISLGLDRFGEEVRGRTDLVELALSLGASRWEAARPAVARAVQTGMIPIINSMMVVGLVSLPGMMTGQLLAGANPATAVRYQIIIMFLIAAATGLGTITAVLLAWRRMFSRDHRFASERVSAV